ncbi:unnamed protein product [Lathyrus oleraceus]
MKKLEKLLIALLYTWYSQPNRATDRAGISQNWTLACSSAGFARYFYEGEINKHVQFLTPPYRLQNKIIVNMHGGIGNIYQMCCKWM